MKELEADLGLDWDVRTRIEQNGIETIDTKPFLNILIIGLFHLYFYAFAASVIRRNYKALNFIFYNDLYDYSFENFIWLLW